MRPVQLNVRVAPAVKQRALRLAAKLDISLTRGIDKDPARRALGRALLTFGESKADPAIPPPQLAAWTMVSTQLLNLDETLNK